MSHTENDNDMNEKCIYDENLKPGYGRRNHDCLGEHTAHQSKKANSTDDNCEAKDDKEALHQLLTPENNKSSPAFDTCSSSQSTSESMSKGQLLQHPMYNQQDVEQRMVIQHNLDKRIGCLDPDLANPLSHDAVPSGGTVSVTEAMSSQESCHSTCDRDKSHLILEHTPEEIITDLQSKAIFSVDKSKISAVPTAQQADELRDLNLVVFNQNEFEEGVMAQVDEAMAAQEQERLVKITEKEMKCLSDDLRSITQELQSVEKIISMLKPEACQNKETQRQLRAVMQQKELKLKQVKKVKARIKSLHARLKDKLNGSDSSNNEWNESSDGAQLMLEQMLSGGTETEQERMIRLGEMTPFGTVMPPPKATEPKPPAPALKCNVSLFDDYLCEEQQKSLARIKNKTKLKTINQESHTLSSKKEQQNVRHQRDDQNANSGMALCRTDTKRSEHQVNQKLATSGKESSTSHNKCNNLKMNKCKPPKQKQRLSADEGVSPETDEEYIPDEDEEDDDEDMKKLESATHGRRKKNKMFGALSDEEVHIDLSQTEKSPQKKRLKLHRSKDDGSVLAYCRRLKHVTKEKLLKKQRRLATEEPVTDSDSDIELGEGFKVPGSLWNKLYRYQKTGVRWLYELHCQQAGGIIGDEMGLGKTIQMIAFLAGLKYSKLRDKGPHSKYCGLGPTIIITPATVMHQWVKEFHTWWPPFRVAVLHASGSYTSSDESLVESIVKSNSILITGYNALVLRQDVILKYDWHYVILDEGHKIRNPDAKVTVAAKMFRTCHRIILSGSPMQNNLKELWSLFDFVFPGKLGTLPDFMAHFSVPIVQGGYANATDIQVRTAYKCACVLRDTINPYLLRRMKADVQNSLQLPEKNEQVLFCRLTDHQREVYIEYLKSRECRQILDGKYMIFPGLISLRKICNHPDLCTGGPKIFDPEMYNGEDKSLHYGYWKRSGKMIVVESLLKLWKKQGQRVLLFSQSKQMLDILERFVQDQEYTYMRMDGGTSIGSRQALIEQFNQDQSVYIFLLTTRVGGLGVNLTGANRVIIFDPDWNPSTDTQARERAWRIGQKRQVTVYRLLTTGTIEEKIYHRQIFKQFLTNRVLKDPKQRRFFKSNDLYDLFQLNDDIAGARTETSDIFAGTGSEVKVKPKKMAKSKHNSDKMAKKPNRFDILHQKIGGTGIDPDDFVPENIQTNSDTNGDSSTEKQLSNLREMAKRLSMKIAGLEQGDVQAGSEKNLPVSMEQKESDDKTRGSAVHQSHKKHKHKEHKKHKQKKKDSYLDGKKISYLDSCDVYRQNNEQDARTNDDYVLAKLFKNKGLHSALHHDKIMMCSDPDYALVESEAERVAKEAALALKRSRSQCFRANTGIPTWTGQSGVPASRPRFGQKKKPVLPPNNVGSSTVSPTKKPKIETEASHFDGKIAGSSMTATSNVHVMSSEDLLVRMKKRNAMLKPTLQEDNEEDHGSMLINTDLPPDDMELITDIRNTIAFCCRTDGQATTQELLDRFGSKVKPDESVKFKAMLRSICDFKKSDDIGVWTLKPEFR